MNQQEIARLAVRLIGLFCLIQGLLYVDSAATALAEQLAPGRRDAFSAFMGIVPLLALLAVGGVLLVYSNAFAKRIAQHAPGQTTAEQWSSQQVLAVALAAVGVYIMAIRLPYLVLQCVQAFQLYQMLQEQGPDAPTARVMVDKAAIILSTAATAALGAYLFVRARNLSDFWHRLQSPATPEAGKSA